LPAFPCISFASTFACINLALFPDETTSFKDPDLESSSLAYLDFNGPCTYFIDRASNFAS
jgi:hypothetical protein